MIFKVYFERTDVMHRALEIEAADAREAHTKAEELLREANSSLDSDFYDRKHWNQGEDSARITGSEPIKSSG